MSEVKDNISAGLGRGLGGKVLEKRAGGGGMCDSRLMLLLNL